MLLKQLGKWKNGNVVVAVVAVVGVVVVVVVVAVVVSGRDRIGE